MPGATIICPDCQVEYDHTLYAKHPCNRGKKPAKAGRYRVSDKEKRTFGGILYASQLEAKRAQELALMKVAREVTEVYRQVKVPLGEINYIFDFLVLGKVILDPRGAETNLHEVWAEDVKGDEPERFRLVRKAWPKYQRINLHVLTKRKGGGWNREVI